MAEDKIRTFLALSFNGFYKNELREALNKLSSYSNAFKWINPEHAHLTLHFFGSVESDRLESIKVLSRNLASRFRPFEIYLSGIGAFPEIKHPRVLWMGIEGEVDELKNLKEACDLELVRIGFPIEDREFKPHLTLGRLRDRSRVKLNLPETLQNYISERKFNVEQIILFKSQLTPDGPVYTPIEQFKFQI